MYLLFGFGFCRRPAERVVTNRLLLSVSSASRAYPAPQPTGQDAPLQGRRELPIRGPPPQPLHQAPVPLRPHSPQQAPHLPRAHLHLLARFRPGQIALLDVVEYLQTDPAPLGSTRFAPLSSSLPASMKEDIPTLRK